MMDDWEKYAAITTTPYTPARNTRQAETIPLVPWFESVPGFIAACFPLLLKVDRKSTKSHMNPTIHPVMAMKKPANIKMNEMFRM